MNIKKILAAFFATAIMATTAITAAYAENVTKNETYSKDYSFTFYANAVNTSTRAVYLKAYQRSSLGKVYSSAGNYYSGTLYLDTGIAVETSTGKELDSNYNAGYYDSQRGLSTNCDDHQTYNDKLSYVHDVSVYGSKGVSSSFIACIEVTVEEK